MVEIELCGKFVLDEGFCHMRRRMKYNELIYMTEGEMYISEDGEDFYHVKAGDMLFLKAGREHYGYEKSEGAVEFYWFHFTGEEEGLPSHFTPGRTGYIVQLYNQLFRYCKISREAANCAATLLVLEAKSESERGKETQNAAAEEIRAWIEVNAVKDISVEKVANRFGYSADYASVLIKNLTGYSIKNYIIYLRLDRAKEMLLSTDMNTKEIGFRCGYKDYKQFLKLFKKHEGITPKGYRESYRYSLINTL